VTAIDTAPRSKPIVRVAHAIVLAWGLRRGLIAFSAGALSALAMAPIDAWPVLFATFPILVWLTDGAAAGRLGGVPSAAMAGWWFGFGYFLAGLYWVGYAFLVDAKVFGWLLPVAVIGLPAFLALYTAFGLALARMLWTRGPTRLIALALALTLAEWLRGHLFTGFPWNTIGYALTGPLVLAQGAALVGIWGLTFAAVLIFGSPAVLADDRGDTRRPWLPAMARCGCRRRQPNSSTGCGCGSCSPTCRRTKNSIMAQNNR
jgi:apolipoprotein N-acyltransferase